MKKVFLFVSALFLVLLVLAGCSLTAKQPPAVQVTEPTVESPAPDATVNLTPPAAPTPVPPPSTSPVPAPPPPPAPPPAALQPKVISLDVGNLFFSPKNLQFKLNQPVRVNYTNNGHHTFTVDGLMVNILLKDNDSGSFTFTPKKEGMFELYCGTPGHRAGGMAGTVTVTK